MNKWWCLLLLILCWTGAGVAIFGARQNPRPFSPSASDRPMRIVSSAPNLTEILFALGLDDRIVGVPLFSNYPPEAGQKPKIGTFWQPNIEAIIAAKPDLVITLAIPQQRDLARRLKTIGCNTLTLNIRKINDFFDAVEKIAAATAKQEQANMLLSGMKKKLSTLSAMVAAEPKPKVLWVVQRRPLRVAGTDTFVNEMIELAGGKNAIGQTIHKYPPIGTEQVIACRPDVIIEPAMEPGKSAQQKKTALEYYSKFSYIPAVKNNRIYVIDADTVSQLGSRLYEGTETIARCLRPQLFGD